MARLSAKERAALPDTAFAYIDSTGHRRLPLNDESHVRNALARFSQVKFESEAAQEKARSRLLKAAHGYGIMPVGFIASQLRSERSRAQAGQASDAATFPTGFVTLMLTDLEGSTGLIQKLGERYESLLTTTREVIRSSVKRAGGIEVDAVGDEMFSVFDDSAAGIEAAVGIQRAMASTIWPDSLEVRVRIGIHSGEVDLTKNGYIGLAVNKAARVCSVGHGGQIVVSDETRSAVEKLSEFRFRDIGKQRLTGLPDFHALFQVEADGLRTNFPQLGV
jgi:class 3 adenylate cyclase